MFGCATFLQNVDDTLSYAACCLCLSARRHPLLLCCCFCRQQLQLHRNGYIPSLMLRLKVLHQYLASCVKLSVDPSEDVPAAEQSTATNGSRDTVQVGAAGHWVSDRPGAKPRLHFVLAEPDGQNSLSQQQQHLRVADRDSDDAKKGGVFEFIKTAAARAAADAAAAEMTEDAAAAAAAVAATEGSGDAAAQQQDREQLQQLEQQLGGRLLSVHQMWQNMPLAVALQVGRIKPWFLCSSLLDVVCSVSSSESQVRQQSMRCLCAVIACYTSSCKLWPATYMACSFAVLVPLTPPPAALLPFPTLHIAITSAVVCAATTPSL
jgi:hypothetical protein